MIIIGTGAGGGTLAHRLAPSRQADPAARARRLPAARAGELGQPRGLPQGALPGTSELWYDKDGDAIQARPALLRRRQHQVLRRDPLPAARARLRRGPAPRRYLAGLAALLRRPRAVLHRGRAPLSRPRPGAARIRPSRRRSGPFPYPAVTHEPRIQQLHDDFERTGHHPFHLPVGVDLDESDPEAGRCVRCNRFDGFPCLVDGKADAHVRCVRPALEHENVDARDALEGRSGSRRTPSGGSVSRVSSSSAAAPTRSTARDIVVVSCGAMNSAVLLLRSASDQHPQRARELLRRRRPPLHGPHQLGRDRDLADAEHDEVPEDPRHQRLLLGRATTSTSRSGTSRCSARPTARSCAPGAPAVCPRPRARLRRPARDRLLAHHRGPPAPGEPRHARPRRARSTSPRPTTTSSRTSGCSRKLKGLLGPLGCHDTADPELVDPRPAHPDRRRRPPVRHGPLRRAIPATSALDVNCKAHDLDNLYVVDTSFFPSCSAVNPALTAMANALARRRSPARAARARRPAAAMARRRQRQATWRFTHEDRGEELQAASARAWSPALPAPLR